MKRKRLRYVSLISILLSICACANHNKRTYSTTAAQTAVVEYHPALELPLPEIPDSIRITSHRAAYLAEHFWDAMDFRDTLRSRNTDFMEQNFSNFISVLPLTYQPAQRAAVEELLYKAETDSVAYILLTDIAETYLYDPNSPMLSEDLYMLFLEKFIDSPILGEYGTLRYRWQLEAVRKNRPGTIAANFAYITPDNRKKTLYRTPTAGDLILVFYDPDCEHCKETMTALQRDETLTRMISDNQLSVLAIHSGDSHELWAETALSLPPDWIAGYEDGSMQEKGLYVFRAMPTLYLLGRNKRVILKDVPVERLIEWLYNNRL